MLVGIFYGNGRPFLTAMLNGCSTPEQFLEGIRRGLEEKVDAFGMQVERLEPKYRTRAVYKELFSATEGKPTYVTDYRRGSSKPEMSDDEIAEEMLLLADCGGVLIDIFGDLFCQTEGELTFEEKAVEKQKILVKQLHDMGAEVLMSSHVLRYLPPKNVLEVALAQQSRGVDIAKIVTSADTEEELLNNFEASVLLRKELKIDSLFLCNGEYSKIHRRFAPLLGSDIVLCIPEKEPSQTIGQPPARMIREIFRLGGKL